MKSNHRGNALLVELLIVVAFFMLSATVLVQVCSKARQLDLRAEREAEAVLTAQDLADRLWAAEDAPALLASLGFAERDGAWERRAEDGVTTRVTVTGETQPAGILRRQEVRVTDADGTALLVLPCSRYLEVSRP